MASTAWKSEERKVAKMFNTTRALMTGTDEKCDIDDPIFANIQDLLLHFMVLFLQLHVLQFNLIIAFHDLRYKGYEDIIVLVVT